MNADIFPYIIPAGTALWILLIWFIWQTDKNERMTLRITRVTTRRDAQKAETSQLTLRRKAHSTVPFISKILRTLPSQSALRTKLDRAGLTLPPDIAITASASVAVVIAMLLLFLKKPLALAILAGVGIGVGLPYVVLGIMGATRVKKFLTLFPDAIDFIVRGLRSGLPVTESMNMVGIEMKEPIGSIFASMGESVRLGMPLERALQDTAKKLASTEFNFFVTSILLQRETGGNLSEILNNLSEVLRKRFMMRMKIKAMSSEAKASAIIVGALPFVVIGALMVISPNYLDPLIDDTRGNIAAAGALLSLLTGIGIMFKMSNFEI